MRLRLFPALAAVFIGLPLLDAVVLILLGRWLTFWPTVALVLISGFVGAGLAKREGTRVWRQIQQEWLQGRVPAQGMIDGAIIFVAGGLLAAPGFITDLLGLSLLLPPVRRPIKAWLRRKVERMIVAQYSTTFEPPRVVPEPQD